MVESIRVLIADDNPRFRQRLRGLLQAAPETEVAGEASNGGEAVALADRLQPDVILMDIKMPDLNGIDATRQILESSPHIGILMLTMVEYDDSVFAAMRAGARGYLLKGALKAEILRAIRGVSSGEAIFGPATGRPCRGHRPGKGSWIGCVIERMMHVADCSRGECPVDARTGRGALTYVDDTRNLAS